MKPVCSNCEVRLIPSRIGVLVVVENECGPYEIWKADELECPKCHAKIVCNFATKPLAEYWQNKQFQAVMATVKRVPGNVVYCREYTGQHHVAVAGES